MVSAAITHCLPWSVSYLILLTIYLPSKVMVAFRADAMSDADWLSGVGTDRDMAGRKPPCMGSSRIQSSLITAH